ncbi:MAG: SAM-dependent methyltransferase [Flavobacterium sp.]|uniref:THUMP-like domain-containing protein n=1 Tax=unclassified Flavobacterium TaxID=196869 RepID=UPI000C400121|nr:MULTISPECIES: class I SAM-dependent methyltransferase [unclassified Flavobacterium]MBF05043.1 SAM-dependent methyltransferase [Flavobacterium sp.]MCO6163074.1 class I SAM-dependent methyltransferase [Flavobacterium sp. NRK F7]
MNPLEILLNEDIQNFINTNLDKDTNQLALQKNNFDVDYIRIINQIVAKQKAKFKLPTWFTTSKILYPSKISIEQTSSEKTAEYKASLISGESLIDLSGGFGVDDYYFSKTFREVIHCEINTELSQIVSHNFKQLQIENCTCHIGESSVILEKLNRKFSWIYVDPSRRNDSKGKVFLLNDCEPNVPLLLPKYFNYSNHILIKTAPLLDIQSALTELDFVKKIHIIALENEVKELLWEIEKGHTGEILVNAVNLEKNDTSIITTSLNKSYRATYSLPKNYLYEPNAAILKSGNFNAISQLFEIDKLHQHSHLYTSDEKKVFPGRSFLINAIVPFQKKEIKTHLENQKMNITTRNFPIKVDEIRKKYKIKEGGSVFAFFTTDIQNNKIVLLCSKI